MIPIPSPQDIEITDNFTWDEALTTLFRNLNNTPQSPEIYDNIYRTAVQMEKVRALLGHPIKINSWYRSPAVNAAVGGSPTSDHMTGSAVDFVSRKFGTPLDICKAIAANSNLVRFKQLIYEHTWVHISWSHIPNTIPKLQVLTLLSNDKYATGLTTKEGMPL